MTGKVFVVGIDGVPPSLLERVVDAGRTPTFEQLQSSAAAGTTRSTIPPISMLAWSTFTTGQSPGKHGLYNFASKSPDGKEAEFVNAKHLRENSIPFWEYLDVEGITSGIFNVMPGFPPSTTAGYHISDYITTPEDAMYSHPTAIEEEIATRFEDFTLTPSLSINQEMGQPAVEKRLSKFVDEDRVRIQASKFLIERHPTAVAVFVFSAPDIFLHEVGHHFDQEHPHYREELTESCLEALIELFELYDAYLQWLIERMGHEDVLVVLSDHGHSPVRKAIDLNAWFHQQGYLRLSDGLHTRIKIFGYNYLFPTLKVALQRTGLYDRVKMGVARSGSDGRVDLRSLLTFGAADIDWDTTVAYTIAGDGQVFLNVDGEDETYLEEVRQTVAASLTTMADPATGQPIIDEVLPGDQVYPGPEAASRPDLVCIPNPGFRIKFPQTMRTRSFVTEPQKWSSHVSKDDLEGVFYLFGDNVSPRSGVEVNLMDFAPSILYHQGIRVPDSMDGTPWTELLSEDRPPTRDSTTGKVYAKRAVRRVVERLR